MISVGIDVSKGKSTVCILKPYGEIISSPYDVVHTAGEMDLFVQFLKRLEGEIRIIMEATGVYHLPVLSVLKENGFFVAVINPYEMKKYASRGIRRVKTDKHDSVTIANYGLDNWYKIKDYSIRVSNQKQESKLQTIDTSIMKYNNDNELIRDEIAKIKNEILLSNNKIEHLNNTIEQINQNEKKIDQDMKQHISICPPAGHWNSLQI